MTESMKAKYILSIAALSLSAAVSAAVPFNEARIYINPGHGGWGPNDRNLETINHQEGDTTGFYETNTNLRKGLQLYHDLVDNGAAEVMLSRTKNGVDNDTEIDGVPQIVNLSAICEDVEANNIDYFISIHSNAASEGNTTNYPLVLYRGTDDEVGNGLVDAKNMGMDAWPYINYNDVTYKSNYPELDDYNVRGDITFMGSSLTTMGYTGYYGVLRHGADGYLIEGCFHTYQPERHRLLNADYCRQEGMRYARAIRAWFDGPELATGDIIGTIKDSNHPLEHELYNYKIASMDAYAPINNTKVVLRNAAGEVVDEYTTDGEYNGLFVFEGLQPGKYTLDFTHLTDYHPYSEEIEVVANQPSYTNVLLTNINEELPDEEEEAPEVEYYTHPEQDGEIAAGSSYEFDKVGETATISALEGLTARRTILRDGKYYILAHDSERAPHLLVVNPETGELVKEMSLEGIVTEGFNGKNMSWTLSDIAFTNDGVLIGTNSVVIGRDGNAYCNGDFYMYAWKGDETTPLEDQKPVIVTTLPTNTVNSIAQAGNNYSNLMANSIAINGDFNEFNFYFDSHAGDGWSTNYGLRYCWWLMKDGEMAATQWNDANPAYDETMFGEDAMMTLSPLGLNRIIIDGSKISSKEFEVDMLTTDAIEYPGLDDETISVETAGANYFRYADAIFMVSPVYTADGNSYGLRLYNITEGLDKAQVIGEYADLITADALLPMSAYGVVRNADIDLYLMAGNQTAKVSTEGIEQATGSLRVMAYGLAQEENEEGTAYTLSFKTNTDVNSAQINIIEKSTGTVVTTIYPEKGEGNTYSATVSVDDLAEDVAYTWEAEVSGDNITRLTAYKSVPFSAPYGVAIDNSTSSEYFGRIYVTNTAEGSVGEQTTATGLYAIEPDGNLEIGNVMTGGISWTGTKGQGPRKVAVAEDGRIFVCDYSTTNTGIYYIDPATFEGKPVFEGAVNDGNGSLTINGTYVAGRTTSIGVRGGGDETQLYAVDATASGLSWRKLINRYDIGSANVWTAAPSEAGYSSSYIGNENNSIVPVSTGYWAAQFRGQGSSSVANPTLFYYSDVLGGSAYDSSAIDDQASANGALAVDEKTGTVVQSYNNGVRVFHYSIRKSDNIPDVEVVFEKQLAEVGAEGNSFAFDYAGNLYTVSSDAQNLTIFGMPTSDNTCATPSSAEFSFGDSSVEELQQESTAKIYPNPTSGQSTVACSAGIESVEVYNAASGAAVLNLVGNGETTMTIDLSGLADGIYFVRVNGTETMKLIKR